MIFFLRSYAPPSAEIAIARIRIKQAATLAQQMTATIYMKRKGFLFIKNTPTVTNNTRFKKKLILKDYEYEKVLKWFSFKKKIMCEHF